MDNEKCTIVVCSCDAYEDTWIPFFKLLKKYWAKIPYPIILNTETKQFEYEGLDIKTINASKDSPWAKRLKLILKQVKTPFVILLLDDFFMTADVDQKRITKCIEWMEQNDRIINFSFAPTLWPDIDDGKYQGFELRPFRGEYKVNMQAAIWRKAKLESILRSHETPWETEIFGTSRARRIKEADFYSAKKDGERIMSYEFGGGIHQGMWTKYTEKLFFENDITIDFTLRGFDPKPTNEWAKQQPTPSLKKRTIGSRGLRFLKNWRSYI